MKDTGTKTLNKPSEIGLLQSAMKQGLTRTSDVTWRD